MGKLDEYRAKRDFSVSPEPPDVETTSSGGLLYVVQKHAASRLHWDFRIELDGVLLSWAVPKGPSLDSSDKRLAVHVEDHPVAYGAFEGTIPQDEYGGGTVMLWDRGTWTPDHGDPREHLAQGHLKFRLHGERLKGRWMLVKTKGYGGKNQDSWLLFKERDDEERPRQEFDATAEWTTSVLTGRTMDEIAAGPALDPALVDGATAAAMPERVDVQLATLSKHVPDGDRWLHEIKFDGYRIVALLDGGTCRLMSRNGHDWTERFSSAARAIEQLSVDNAVLDGEMVVLREDGISDFQLLQDFARGGGEGELRYQAFDLLHLNGHDLTRARLEDRKRLLSAVVPPNSMVRYTDHIEGHGDALLDQACGFSLEGVVSKRRDAPYRPGRGRDWLKTKCVQRQEFVVVGWTDPEGSRAEFGALVLAARIGDRLAHAGRVGSGFTDAALAEVAARLAPLVREDPPIADAPAGAEVRGIHWVEPELVAEVSFAEKTREGNLRDPVFVGLREDKAAEEVEEEKPVDPPSLDEPAEPAAPSSSPVVAGVRLSHPERVLWPDVPLTKLDLARYLEAVAGYMLPHIEDRPLSLVRCPAGYTAECFFQKHAKNFPASVKTVPVEDTTTGEMVPYASVRDVAGLIGLAQMGVLEIHPWGSRNDRMDRPDRLIFDLDPDPKLPFSATATTALLLRSELSRLGLESWLKSTGGKGLHVVVPLERRHSWEEVRTFARAFVDSIVALQPQLFTGTMSKAKREGRIFIDHMRNARGATAVAAYSPRARAGAPVSVPLFWEEIEGVTDAPLHTVLTVPGRLAELTVDPWAGIGVTHQRLGHGARLGPIRE